MAKKLSGLGRGIDAIFLENTMESEQEQKNGSMKLRVSQMEPKGNQPRKYFDTEALAQLAESIAAHGVLQPILVRDIGGDRYQIIAGERRWRASKMAGLSEVPVVLLDSTEQEAAQIALIENIQREDLNPLEEAAAYKSLADEYHLTQEEISRQIGKSRSAIANAVRLLDLPEAVRPHVASGELSAGHARALLGLRYTDDIAALAQVIIDRGLSVRMTEDEVKRWNRRRDMEEAAEETAEEEKPQVVNYAKDLENRIMASLGRRVKLDTKRGKSCITFFYEDNEDLEAFLRHVVGNDFFDETV
ncbi:MAG: ParB/RepB/Spo0J family partition protein [Clostridia bacterium]|nr:ParB/RepB/Spo0J family partition protein [Clostridia bacterium]